MRQKIGLIFLGASLIFLLSMSLNFAQEQTALEQNATEQSIPEPETQVLETPTETQTQWVWAGVVSVDTQKNELVVKCLDYETDQEKEMAITVDDQTTYENAKAISEIKPQDTVSIDYIVTAEGKNIAKNISVEKPESGQAPAEGGAPEVSPEDLTPLITPE